MRILHLGFEDHRRPGSGGGGIRTREINRRLASRHDITVVTSRYPGAVERVEDGVRYRPLGLDLGHLASMATYHLAIPFYLAFHEADLVVEDFAAPVSSALVPLWTRRPTVAVVQWLAARETSKRYHLPFFVFEELGMRLHRRFVAVSESIAERLRSANPRADVRVVYAGVERPPPCALERNPGQLLYLGRLELEPKGLDLLVEATRRLGDLPGLRVLVAGDGPHRAELEHLVVRSGQSGRIVLVGRVEGANKARLLATSCAVVVPSRYESFGMVAAEAMAAGTPVAGWALPSLAEIVAPGAGRLVEPFDVDALGEAIRFLLAGMADPSRRAGIEKAARAVAARFDWDRAAAAQEAVYLEAAGVQGRRGSVTDTDGVRQSCSTRQMTQPSSR